MTDQEVVLTPEGFKRLSEEIEHLSSVKREEISERIRDAREFGDISENSEYNEAKNEQAKLEMRIINLAQKLRNARILAAKEITTDSVGIGSLVSIKDVKEGDNYKYTIVSSAEADPSNHRLSNDSPVGKAIIGKKAGETVKVTTPRGSMKYKIVSIKKG